MEDVVTLCVVALQSSYAFAYTGTLARYSYSYTMFAHMYMFFISETVYRLGYSDKAFRINGLCKASALSTKLIKSTCYGVKLHCFVR